MRKNKEISDTYNELVEKVWWYRHQILSKSVKKGNKSDIIEEAFTNAKRIEDKYGIDSLSLSDYEWVIMEGRLSALAWVLGSEWEGSLDT